MIEEVILVNTNDEEIGLMEKMEAHEKGILHRAFSIFIFNDNNEMLLQQRAFTKYHSAGLWTNACCSHPRKNESNLNAATRRLQEEMGFTTALTKIFNFTYKATFDNNLIEHEYDHVFIGKYNDAVLINPNEAQDFCYKSITQIQQLINTQPQQFTAWFLIAFPKVVQWLQKQ